MGNPAKKETVFSDFCKKMPCEWIFFWTVLPSNEMG